MKNNNTGEPVSRGARSKEPAILHNVQRALALLLAAAWVSAPAATPDVSAADSHSLALHADGTVRSWGDDSHGALGVGRSLISSSPRTVEGLFGVKAVAASGEFTVTLKMDGTVW